MFIDLMVFVDFATEMWYNVDESHVEVCVKNRALQNLPTISN